ncbi:MobF family relaxase [Xanthomonas cerealis]|uniref:MobF family relaxase n=1 Tax=Xanthomonas cerealis TaxID=3390025 RepID=UPI000AB810AC|nr:MobF family relaxase [Xanthomonas translucens]UKE46229.1 relaxase domain-containing protein [Xanthomonas translucens pv. cerealis]
MINVTPLSAQGKDSKSGAAVVEYLMATEYYLNKEGHAKEAMAWGGKMAAHLNLQASAVTRERMTKLAEGFDPLTGRALCQNAGQKGKVKSKVDKNGDPLWDDKGQPEVVVVGGHRVGYDVTISAPKDVGIAFALGTPEERDAILQAHQAATALAMGRLEAQVETRRGKGGKDVIGVKGLVWSSHQHFAGRDLDMDLHTHHLVYGVALGEDGKESTFDAVEIWRNARSVDEVYKLELYKNLQALGYPVEHIRELDDDGRETNRTFARLAGVDQEVIDAFSKRRKALLEYAEQHGVSKQQANKATRKHKDEPNYQELMDHWQEALKGFDVSTETVKLAQGNLETVEHKSDAELLELLHQNEAVFNDIDLVRVLGMEYAGKLDAAGLDARIEQFKTDNGLVLVNAERLAEEDRGVTLARKHTEDRFCAPWMLEAEQAVVDIANRRANETQHHASQATVDRVIEDYQQAKGFQLSQEQLVAVNHICRGSGGVANLSGLAGTGKTTISMLYKEALESEGMVLLGVCVSNKAAQKLEAESGMPSVSMAQMLHDLAEGKRELQPNDVIVIDEAGMVDTRDTRALLAHAEKAKAKVILQGDAEQLQPIGAGSGFQLTKQAVGDVKLTEIRRQARQEDRETAMGFYAQDENGAVIDLKKGTRSRRETLDMGDKQKERLLDSIVEAHSQEKSIERLVSDFFKNPAKLDDKLVLAHSRAEVSVLNAGIRKGLKERGEIGTTEVVVEGRHNGRKFDLPLVEGDRVMFTAKNKDLGVVNGTQATIQSIKPSRSGGYDIVGDLRSENPKEHGRKVIWNTHEHKALVHDYAVTVHKSQGQGKREVFHLMNLGMMDNASSLVAFTRLTKGSYKLYGTYDDVERLNERLGLERLKATVLDAGLKNDPKAKVESDDMQEPVSLERPTVRQPATQRSGIQGKLDALMKEHQEQRQAQSRMSESERKARRLLEVFEPFRRANRAQHVPAAPMQVPGHRQGF